MTNETLFYICGGVLAVSAVLVSFAGLKIKSFPGKAMPIVVLWFVVFVGAAATFAVRGSQDEEVARAAELAEANEEIEAAETTEPFEEEEAGTGGEEAEPEAEPAEPLVLEADVSLLAFDTTELEAKAGTVTIDLGNPAPIPHNVAIAEEGKELATTETITEGKSSLTTELEPGTYTFLCTVPGHAAAGMEGTLTVK